MQTFKATRFLTFFSMAAITTWSDFRAIKRSCESAKRTVRDQSSRHRPCLC